MCLDGTGCVKSSNPIEAPKDIVQVVFEILGTELWLNILSATTPNPLTQTVTRVLLKKKTVTRGNVPMSYIVIYRYNQTI